MDTTDKHIDDLMEAATGALMRRDYLSCERDCLEALKVAKERQDWAYYARILLPLQEARRQKRMIAAGAVRLGTGDLRGDPREWVQDVRYGCIVVTDPHDPSTAVLLRDTVRHQDRCIEVLYADHRDSGGPWMLQSFSGVRVSCGFPSPPSDWVDRWFFVSDLGSPPPPDSPPGSPPPDPGDKSSRVETGPQTPGDWFLDACEALGDATLGTVEPALSGVHRIDIIEQCLEAVPDHELLHQHLGAAARAMTRGVSS